MPLLSVLQTSRNQFFKTYRSDKKGCVAFGKFSMDSNSLTNSNANENHHKAEVSFHDFSSNQGFIFLLTFWINDPKNQGTCNKHNQNKSKKKFVSGFSRIHDVKYVLFCVVRKYLATNLRMHLVCFNGCSDEQTIKTTNDKYCCATFTGFVCYISGHYKNELGTSIDSH